MKLAWATDIHLDFCAREIREQLYGGIRGADAVIVTGDIAESRTLEPLLLEMTAAVDMPLYFVLGNHDFYGSNVSEVRERARAFRHKDDRLRWLPAEGVVMLQAGVALVGHDGWADGRCGDWVGSRVQLTDYLSIGDLAPLRSARLRLLDRMQALAAEGAKHVRDTMRRALATHDRLIVATHVPPYREACWHEGKISDDQWLPHFSSAVMGDAISEVAREHPRADITVLCGHTHGEGTAQILPNVIVRTGGAVYGRPAAQPMIDL
jgi:predicted phosphodiesterase